jgi:hypothetical protein
MRKLLHTSERNSEKCREENNELKLQKEKLHNTLESLTEEKSR